MKSNPPRQTNSNSVNPVAGIHHVTAIASDPQENIDFYAGLLGLRLVKKTVNFDDPSAYHVYYGDETGTPGSIVTFFYWPNAAGRGRVGAGQTTALTFSAPAGSLSYWQERLERHGLTVTASHRFGEDTLRLSDPDGIPVEIVAVADDSRSGFSGAGIPAEYAIRGLHLAELTVRNSAPTEQLLTNEMGFQLVRREGNRARFQPQSGGSGRFVDVIADATGPSGSGGPGTIHHIAWRVADDASQLVMQERLYGAGYSVSTVRDRDYFRSIYYRERGGILFEIATDSPGFTVDEAVAELGTSLKLPKQFESARAEIEDSLPPLERPRTYA